jgi:hypothetical protein
MRSAEGGQEIIKRYFVCHIDRSETKAPLVSVSTKYVVIPYRIISGAY